MRAIILSLLLCLPVQAITFDGVDDHIPVGQLGHNLAAFTFSAWIKSPGQDNFEGIAGNEESGIPSTKHIFIGRNSTSANVFVRVSNNDGNDQQITTSNPLSTTDWNHLVVVFDGAQAVETDKCRIYVDGVLQPDSVAGTMPATTRALTTTFYLGSALNDANYWSGEIDDPRLYSRAMSAAEVSAFYNATRKRARKRLPGITSTGLIGHWEFKDGPIGRELNVMRDYGRFDLDAKPTTSGVELRQQLVTDIAVNAPGRFAVQLPGTDWLRCDDADEHTFSDGSDLPFSLTAWVRLNSLNGQCLFCKGDSSGNTEYVLRLSNASGNNMQWQLFSGGSSTVNFSRYYAGPTSDLFTVGQWRHVACTYDPAGATTADKLKFYINNVRQDNNQTSVGSYVGMVNTNAGLQLGRYLSTSEYLDGDVDNMQLWNKALSVAEIDALYRNARDDVNYPNSGNVVSDWDMESSHNPLDSSGNANHGDAIGGSSLTFSAPAAN